ERRLLAQPEAPVDSSSNWSSWSLNDVVTLVARDRGGVGTLEAFSQTRRLGAWRYTVALAAAARDFVEAFDHLKSGVPVPAAGETDVEKIEAEARKAPVNLGALFRLLVFARPHIGAMALGAVLTMATTASSLAPTYLIKWIGEALTDYSAQVTDIRED